MRLSDAEAHGAVLSTEHVYTKISGTPRLRQGAAFPRPVWHGSREVRLLEDGAIPSVAAA